MGLRDAIRGWGATPEELAARLPCDDLARDGQTTVDRAVDTDAPPHAVYRWLCQLRVAPYSYDLLDNFGRRSPRELTPGMDELEPGQRFMTIFRLVSFEPGEHITLRTRSGGTAVTYRVTPGRLHMRAHISSRIPGIALGDLIMARKQLLTLSELARRAPAASGGDRPPPGSRAPSGRGRG